MKKKLIASTLLTLIGISGAATAAVTFTGKVEITGKVSKAVPANLWQWDSGTLQTLDTTTAALDSATNKIMTVAAAKNMPILIGQTTDVAVGRDFPQPRIVLTTVDGKSAPINFTTAVSKAGNGKGVLTLPVTDDAGTDKIGTLTLNVTTAGIVNYQNNVTPFSQHFETSIGSANNSAPIKDVIPSSGNALSTAAAATFLSALGVTKVGFDYINFSNAKVSYVNTPSNTTVIPNASDPAFSKADTATLYGMRLGIGVAKDENIVINFDNEIYKKTKWKSAVNVNITYL